MDKGLITHTVIYYDDRKVLGKIAKILRRWNISRSVCGFSAKRTRFDE